MVAGYMTRELAAITWQDLARHVHPYNSTIDLAQDVYAVYVSIEGISYLRSLHNSPPEGDGRGQRIHDSRQGHIIRMIYIAYDHLGIRSVHFSLPNSDLPSLSRGCCGVWWTELAQSSGHAQVATQSDVSLPWLHSYRCTYPNTHLSEGPESETAGFYRLPVCKKRRSSRPGLAYTRTGLPTDRSGHVRHRQSAAKQPADEFLQLQHTCDKRLLRRYFRVPHIKDICAPFGHQCTLL